MVVRLRDAGVVDEEEDDRDELNFYAGDAQECSYFVGSSTSVGALVSDGDACRQRSNMWG